MEKNIVFLFLVVLVAVFQIVPATGHKQTSSELTAAKKHNLKIKSKSSRHHQTKQMHYDPKCWPHRCNIICPIQVQPMPSYPNVPNAPIAPAQAPIPTPAQAPLQTAAQASAPTSRTPADTFPINPATPTTGSPVSNRTAPGGVVPQLANGLNNLNHYLDRGLKVLLGNLQHMTKRQKRILTKHYVLGTRNGKKAFKFRQQFAPFGCYVQCEESQQSYPVPQQSYPLQQQIPPGAPSSGGIEQLPVGGGGDDGEDGGDEEEDDDVPYQEGEDKPIEVTASPPDRRQYSMGNDFIPMEDYGEPFFFEDKKKKSRSHYRHHKN